MITIYTDGAARGNPGPGGWGAIVLSDDRAIEIGGDSPQSTNNRMELTAAIKAIEFATENLTPGDSMEVNTDSEYVMKGITEWIKTWQAKSWKTANKKAVKNLDLWEQLLIVTEDREIKWSYVAGHSGHALNERCDEIATAFADGLEVTLYNGDKSFYPVHI